MWLSATLRGVSCAPVARVASTTGGARMTEYAPLDPFAVADMLDHFAGEWKYASDDKLATVMAHAELILDVARYEGEIEHATEWLDMVFAEHLAAFRVLQRRSERGYSIHESRPGGFDRAWLDDLKARVQINEIVRHFGGELHRRSRGWLCRCPLPDHDDRYPSFYVYDDTNSCWCFGCQRGGDVFALVMLVEDVEFVDAVKWVAHRAGVEMPQRARPEKPASHGSTWQPVEYRAGRLVQR